MILKLPKNCDDNKIEEIKSILSEEKAEHYMVDWQGQKVIICKKEVTGLPSYVEFKKITTPYKLASREFQPEKTVVDVDGVAVGGNKIIIMAGPCAVENKEDVLKTAVFIKSLGVPILRGGAFKPRTTPYAFRGLGKEGLKILAEVKKETGVKIITEVMTPEDIDLVAEYADILQIGARNMQNFILLDRAGKINKPVLLKRGMSATIEEWILAAEYILSQGNPNVILCERGIRTYEKATRNTLDLGAVAFVKEVTHLPVIVDPSHAVGIRQLVPPLSKASIAAGADGLIVEVHPCPEKALCDGSQSLTFTIFEKMMEELKLIASAVNREL